MSTGLDFNLKKTLVNIFGGIFRKIPFVPDYPQLAALSVSVRQEFEELLSKGPIDWFEYCKSIGCYSENGFAIEDLDTKYPLLPNNSEDALNWIKYHLWHVFYPERVLPLWQYEEMARASVFFLSEKNGEWVPTKDVLSFINNARSYWKDIEYFDWIGSIDNTVYLQDWGIGCNGGIIEAKGWLFSNGGLKEVRSRFTTQEVIDELAWRTVDYFPPYSLLPEFDWPMKPEKI